MRIYPDFTALVGSGSVGQKVSIAGFLDRVGHLGGVIQGSSEAEVISHSQNEDFSTFQISELSGFQITSLNLRISRN